MENVIPLINHKGEHCNIINKLCQEGYCNCCEAYLASRRNLGGNYAD